MDDRKRTLLSAVLLAVVGFVLSGCTSTSTRGSKCPSCLRLPSDPRRLSKSIPLPTCNPICILGMYPRSCSPARKYRSAARAPMPLVQRAGQRFQRGKKYYQANDFANARREFDGAIDLMLEASAQDPGDRQEYVGRLDEMVDAIHRYDLAGMGASRPPWKRASSSRLPWKTSSR